MFLAVVVFIVVLIIIIGIRSLLYVDLCLTVISTGDRENTTAAIAVETAVTPAGGTAFQTGLKNSSRRRCRCSRRYGRLRQGGIGTAPTAWSSIGF